jgi:hypothetical protein
MTVPHGLRSSYQRDEARRELIDELVATTDGRAFLEALQSIEDWYAFDLVAELLSSRLAVDPAALPHRRAKQKALGRDKARRRRPDVGTPANHRAELPIPLA